MSKDIKKQVFINCPFDQEYKGLLYAMLFTLISLGYYPRLSLESSNSTITRIEKIIGLIRDCQLCIHDLSRIQAKKKDEYYRLNMAFETGMDFGYKSFSNDPNVNNRKTPILGRIKYEYMKAISDLSGFNIEYHNNALQLVKVISGWLVLNEIIIDAPTPSEIWYKYTDYTGEYKIYTEEKGYVASDFHDIPLNERVSSIDNFITINPY